MGFKNILAVMLLICVMSCKKDAADQNPFENETSLDCRNLKVIQVVFNNRILNKLQNIHVTIENTCKTCDDNGVYLGLFMIDKTTSDTVARTCLNCLIGIRDKQKGTYELATNLTSLPDMNNITFNYSYLCNDVPYKPR